MSLSRRRFLAQGGLSLAGVMLVGSRARALAASPDAATRPAAPSDAFPGHLVDDLAAVVADLQRKFPYASGLFTSQSGIAITRDRNGLGVSESGAQTRGVSLRVFDGGSFHEAATGDDSADGLRAARLELERRVAVGMQRYRIEPLPAHEETWRTRMVEDPEGIALADRVARVEAEFARVEWNDPRVRSVRVSTNVQRIRRAFVDRTRRLASDTTSLDHSAAVIGFDQGRPGTGFARHSGQAGLELARLDDRDLEKLRREFADSFRTESVPAGTYDVVFSPPVSGLLAHESFGHGVEMDQFVKDRAKAREYLGKAVAASMVTMLDDPSVPAERGSYPFDDEGVLAQPTTIIRDGVFVQPLTDLMSATFLGTTRTPNGRTQAWDHKVYARMSNTFFANGTSDPDEMIASLENGLYVDGFRNGVEDPQGWGIQFTARMAHEVKNGKRTGRLFAPVTVTGYVPDILSAITMVGNDLDYAPGSCGKGFKEFVPVTSGGPHLRTRARVS